MFDLPYSFPGMCETITQFGGSNYIFDYGSRKTHFRKSDGICPAILIMIIGLQHKKVNGLKKKKTVYGTKNLCTQKDLC